MSVFAELKRRNVIRVATAYVAFSWLIIQVLETLLPIFGISEATARAGTYTLSRAISLIAVFRGRVRFLPTKFLTTSPDSW